MTDETKKNETAEAAKTEVKAEAKKPAHGQRGRSQKNAGRRPQKSDLDVDLEERVVAVNRVAKVVKGGRRFSFSALMIVGDKKGRVGYGLGKAKEVPEAIRKATQQAQRSMITVPLDQGTIPHVIMGEFDAGQILFKPAADGTGVKAAGACRSILELAGVRNVLTKSLRGNNPHNIVKATFAALRSLRSIEEVARVRGRDFKTLRMK
ncbi:MAG: 30S ribosomal protein S5 [Bacteriovoracaceae bacterium]|jgi:small subunit ribosomal protein S5|nr:30S ribosomal protein S5 [Bacteriovoracaceae bacterium]